MSAAKKGMKKSTYLIIWTLVIALLGSAVGVVNYEALYWDSALTLYFGEVGVKNVSTVTFDTDDHAQVANLIVAEGAVLLKNEKNALPMKGGKISLFGIDNKSGVLQKVLEEEGFTVNQYFLDHPEMVLGRPTAESTQYGKQDYTVVPIEGLDLADQLHDAVKYIRGTYQEAALPELGEGEDIDESLPADPNVKNYSYTVVDGAVYFRENSHMVRPDLNATAEARVKGLVGLRDCVQQLIDLEMDAAAPDADIRAQYGCFAGVDEAGRGPLCGPVCVAACILDPEAPVYGINDSKKLSEKKREALFDQIVEKALAYKIVFVGPDIIDRDNILNATMGGMRQAVEGLDIVPNLVLIDGNRAPAGLTMPAQPVVKGDATSASIGAASILAKVSRDRYMLELDKQYPQYQLAKHKGYPTKLHYELIAQYGIQPFYRRSFLKKQGYWPEGK